MLLHFIGPFSYYLQILFDRDKKKKKIKWGFLVCCVNFFLCGKTGSNAKKDRLVFLPQMFLSSYTNEVLSLSFIKGKFPYTVKCANRTLP